MKTNKKKLKQKVNENKGCCCSLCTGRSNYVRKPAGTKAFEPDMSL